MRRSFAYLDVLAQADVTRRERRPGDVRERRRILDRDGLRARVFTDECLDVAADVLGLLWKVEVNSYVEAAGVHRLQVDALHCEARDDVREVRADLLLARLGDGVRGSNRQAILWQLFGECRFMLGPADFNPRGTWSEGATPTLRLAVMKVLAFIVNGVSPADGRA